jgi:asparagine synthase (glutamine-hydrolysing)
LVRRVLRRYLPEAFFARPKHGFNVPIGAWLKGPLRDWAEELLAKPRLRGAGFLDPDRVQACWHEHVSGGRDRANELWAILMVGAWLNAADKPATESPLAKEVENAVGITVSANGRTEGLWPGQPT